MDLVCIFIPLRFAELYHAQGWELTWVGHHSNWSLLACREVEAD